MQPSSSSSKRTRSTSRRSAFVLRAIMKASARKNGVPLRYARRSRLYQEFSRRCSRARLRRFFMRQRLSPHVFAFPRAGIGRPQRHNGIPTAASAIGIPFFADSASAMVTAWMASRRSHPLASRATTRSRASVTRSSSTRRSKLLRARDAALPQVRPQYREPFRLPVGKVFPHHAHDAPGVHACPGGDGTVDTFLGREGRFLRLTAPAGSVMPFLSQTRFQTSARAPYARTRSGSDGSPTMGTRTPSTTREEPRW